MRKYLKIKNSKREHKSCDGRKFITLPSPIISNSFYENKLIPYYLNKGMSVKNKKLNLIYGKNEIFNRMHTMCKKRLVGHRGIIKGIRSQWKKFNKILSTKLIRKNYIIRTHSNLNLSKVLRVLRKADHNAHLRHYSYSIPKNNLRPLPLPFEKAQEMYTGVLGVDPGEDLSDAFISGGRSKRFIRKSRTSKRLLKHFSITRNLKYFSETSSNRLENCIQSTYRFSRLIRSRKLYRRKKFFLKKRRIRHTMRLVF
jgi:hypothetical protein